jgi:hypothetical protein
LASAPLIIAVAIVVTLLAVAGLRFGALRSRRGLTSLTEAEARAHALPLTKSVLSVGPSSGPRGASAAPPSATFAAQRPAGSG